MMAPVQIGNGGHRKHKEIFGVVTGVAVGVFAFYVASHTFRYFERSRRSKKPKDTGTSAAFAHKGKETSSYFRSPSTEGTEFGGSLLPGMVGYRRVMAITQGSPQLTEEELNKHSAEANMRIEEARAATKGAGQHCPLPSFPLTNIKRKPVPEALEKGKGSKTGEATVLEREADQLDQQGRAAATKQSHPEPSHKRPMAGALPSETILPARKPGLHEWVVQQWGRDLHEVIELLQEGAQRKVAPVSLGGLDIQRWLEVQADAGLGVEIAETLEVTASLSVSDLSWEDSAECTHHGRHIHHLKKLIQTGGQEIEWVEAAQAYPELLSCQMLGHNLTGTTDVLAAERSAVSAGSPQKGMRLLMDIRRGITTTDVIQAQARVLLGNLRCPKPRPPLVLTDLDNEWHAMWLDGSTIYQHAFASVGLALGFIEDLLAGRYETSPGISQTSFAKRRQIDDRHCANSAYDGAFAKQVQALSMPSNSIRSSS